MKTPLELFDEFKKMPLGKQSLVALTTITIIVTFLSNYKTLKNGSKEIVEKFTQDANVKEFMEDVTKVLQSFSKVCKKFFANGVKDESNTSINE